MKSLLDSALSALRSYIEKKHDGNVASAAQELDISVPTLHTWMKGTRIPSFSKMAPLLEKIGAYIVSPDERQGTARDVCFVEARTVPAGEHLESPDMEEYLAVPLVEEVGAGPGLIPQGQLIAWFLVWRHQRAIQHKRDLIAVRIGKHSTSMIPTLRPQDIVLVDRQDTDVQNFTGRIMLVMDPDGCGKIKRVASEHQPRKRDYRITYYSDNAVENPPEVYSLMEDFQGDWTKAVVGRVVWAWSDVSCK